MQLLSSLLIENAISNEVNLCLTKALTLADYLQMSNLQVKFLPPVFNFRIGSFVFPQLTGLVWVYTICCCVLQAQSPVSTRHNSFHNNVIVLWGSFLLYTRRHPKYYNVEVSKLSSTSKRSCRWNNEYFSLINGFIQVVNMVYLHVKLTMSRCFHVLSKLSFTAFSFGYPLSSINILGSSLREFYSWKQSCIH